MNKTNRERVKELQDRYTKLNGPARFISTGILVEHLVLLANKLPESRAVRATIESVEAAMIQAEIQSRAEAIQARRGVTRQKVFNINTGKAPALLLAFALIFAAGQHAQAAEGGTWPKSGSLPEITAPMEVEYYCDEQPVADQASSRIPTATHTGTVNTRFQWVPGYLDYARGAFDIARRVVKIGASLCREMLTKWKTAHTHAKTVMKAAVNPGQQLREAFGISF